MTLRQVVVASALLAFATCATAQDARHNRPPGREHLDIVQNWIDRLRLADQALQAGEWKKAKKTSDFLLEDMRERLIRGADAPRFLGHACLYRAIAESGLGRKREAAWDFAMAQALHPGFSRADFKPYGAAGAALEAARGTLAAMDAGDGSDAAGSVETHPASGESASSSTSAPPSREEALGDSSAVSSSVITSPVKLHAPPPPFPYAKNEACDTGTVVVTMIIGRDGLPMAPTLSKGADPVLGFNAMETVRSWKFRPARLGGKPVSVFYNLAVNYKQMYCPNRLAAAAGKP